MSEAGRCVLVTIARSSALCAGSGGGSVLCRLLTGGDIAIGGDRLLALHEEVVPAMDHTIGNHMQDRACVQSLMGHSNANTLLATTCAASDCCMCPTGKR